MKTVRSSGFTLIELLTVIAIIAILAAFTAAGLPRVLERAKLADVQNDFNQIRTALTVYYTDNDSYPLGYGFRTWTSRQIVIGAVNSPGADPGDVSNPLMFNMVPYMEQIGEYGSVDLYDRFASSEDANEDGLANYMEFTPLGTRSGNYFGRDVPTTVYIDVLHWVDLRSAAEAAIDSGSLPSGNPLPELERPYIYAPINKDMFRRFKRAVEGSADADMPFSMRNFPADTGISVLVPPRYDAFVLLSVGPGGTTAGLACPEPGNADAESNYADSVDAGGAGLSIFDVYQALALRTYYLATRDLNENGVPDLSFLARTRQKETNALIEYFNGDELAHRLPDGSFGAGPLIYEHGGE